MNNKLKKKVNMKIINAVMIVIALLLNGCNHSKTISDNKGGWDILKEETGKWENLNGGLC